MMAVLFLVPFALRLMKRFGLLPVVATGIVGTKSWMALYIGMAAVTLGLIPLCFGRGTGQAIEGEHRARIFYFFRVAPVLMVAGLMFGLIDEFILALLIVYGERKGLVELAATFLLTSFLFVTMGERFKGGELVDITTSFMFL